VDLREPERPGPDLLTVRPRLPTEPATPDAPPQPPDDPPLVRALRCFHDRRPAEAVASLEHYDRGNQELLLSMLPVMVRLTEVGLGQMDPAEVAALAAQLEGSLGPLRKRAPLVIERMCFCQFIKNFGDYEPWPAEHVFCPGNKVEVYVQFRQLATEALGGGHAPRLRSKLRILTPDGREAAPGLDISEQDHGRPSRSPRQDLYYACWFRIPKDLPPGTYTFLLDVTDVATGRVARKSLELRVGGGVPTAGGIERTVGPEAHGPQSVGFRVSPEELMP
jgi:hypothetical protein